MQNDLTFTPVVQASGAAVQTITVADGVSTWIVSQISVEMSSAPVGATCAIRKDGYLVTPIIPTGDTASGEPPITLRPGSVLSVEWAGCTPGDVGRILVNYDDGK